MPLEVYEVTGAGPVRTRLQAAAVRGLTRFVGREAEIEQLRQALKRAEARRGQVVALVGEPGVGKPRLVYEFTRSHRTQGWLLLQSSSVSYGRATPYLPVIDLLKAYFGIEPRDDARRMRERVAGKLLILDEALTPTLPAFLALLDVPVEGLTWQALAQAEELGMCPLVAHCRLGIGMLYHKIDRGEEARAELSTAIELYRTMDMTFWLPPAKAALAQVEGK